MGRRKAVDLNEEQINLPGMPEDEPQSRAKRVSIPLKEDGTLDTTGMRESSREKLRHALAKDPTALAQFGGVLPAEAAAVESVVTAEHVNFFLDGYQILEQWVMPQALERQNPGKKFPKELQVCFTLTKEHREKLIPHGIQFFNENLPLWLKEWLLKTGAGGRFFGGLALITWTQAQIAIQMWKAKEANIPGVAVEGEFKVADTQPINGGETAI